MPDRGEFNWNSERNKKMVQYLLGKDTNTRECVKIVVLMRLVEELQNMNARGKR